MQIKLAQFIVSLPCGFITEAQLPQLVELDRLCLLLVRLGGPGGRFLAPAQNVAQLMQYAEKGGDYVRDVSVASEVIKQAKSAVAAHEKVAAQWKAAAEQEEARKRNWGQTLFGGNGGRAIEFNEAECGGAFDGHQVISDADPGL